MLLGGGGGCWAMGKRYDVLISKRMEMMIDDECQPEDGEDWSEIHLNHST